MIHDLYNHVESACNRNYAKLTNIDDISIKNNKIFRIFSLYLILDSLSYAIKFHLRSSMGFLDD